LRVATDRGRGEPGHDAEADTGADDPEGRETCAEMFHLRCSSLVPGAGAPRALDRHRWCPPVTAARTQCAAGLSTADRRGPMPPSGTVAYTGAACSSSSWLST